MVALSTLLVVSGTVLLHLSTGSMVGDILVGVGLAVVLFLLYYLLVLRPARRPPKRRGSDEPPSRNDTGN